MGSGLAAMILFWHALEIFQGVILLVLIDVVNLMLGWDLSMSLLPDGPVEPFLIHGAALVTTIIAFMVLYPAPVIPEDERLDGLRGFAMGDEGCWEALHLIFKGQSAKYMAWPH